MRKNNLVLLGVVVLSLFLGACSKSKTSAGGSTASTQLNWDQGNWNQQNWQ